MRIDLAVQEGDIIVAASDGMGDNLWDEDVLEEVVKWGSDVKGLSEALAKRALGVSEGGAFVGETPFGRRAHEEKRNHVGGKADDISVLVAVIEGCDAVGLSMNSRSAIASR
jgi:protein phosphatase PTC7